MEKIRWNEDDIRKFIIENKDKNILLSLSIEGEISFTASIPVEAYAELYDKHEINGLYEVVDYVFGELIKGLNDAKV